MRAGHSISPTWWGKSSRLAFGGAFAPNFLPPVFIPRLFLFVALFERN
jgi:hypothetical protein